jgi:uncharacterized membrane protein YqjE
VNPLFPVVVFLLLVIIGLEVLIIWIMDRHSMSAKRGHTESISSIPGKGVKVCVF